MSMINVHFHAKLYAILDMVSHYNLAGVYKDRESRLFEFNSREAAREYCLKPTGWRRGLTARIELVILDLMRRKKALSSASGKISKLSRLQPVLALIESDLADPDLSVTDMAVEMDVSEVYLRVLFQMEGI